MSERMRARAAGVLRAVLSATALLAGVATPAGAEFPVNIFTTGDQGAFAGTPQVSRAPDGRFVVVWSSAAQDGSGQGVYGQVYDAAGGAGSVLDIPINTTTANDQQAPSVAMRSVGEFFVVWEDSALDGSGPGVYSQLFLSSGSPTGSETRVNQTTAQNQDQPQAAATGGGYIVVWRHLRIVAANSLTIFTDIYGRIYDGNGTPVTGEFPISDTSGFQDQNPAVSANSAGDFVVVWQRRNFSNASLGIFGRRYNAAGTPQGAEFQVNTFTASQFIDVPEVAMDESGAFVAVWETNGEVQGWDIFARRFDAAGVGQGNEFLVNTNFTLAEQLRPDVAVDADGEFIVAWSSLCSPTCAQDGTLSAVLARRYTSGGAPVGNEFVVNTFTTARQDDAAVAMSEDLNAVAVWSSEGQDGSGYGVFGQRYDALVFRDGVNSGNTARWSVTVP